jgi:hypothetical protein
MGKTRNISYKDLYDEYKLKYPDFENCPYFKNQIGTNFELEETAYFVRLYSGNAKSSKWIFRIEDLKKYKNIDELINDLAIPYDNGTVFGTIPSKITIVEVPEGTMLRKTIAGEQNWGRSYDNLDNLIQKGGGTQYEILNFNNLPSQQEWFKEVGSINELFK